MHFLTPSLLGGGWEVEHALFDRISNTVSSCLVHFMIILVVFLAVESCSTSHPPPRRDGIKKCMLNLLVCGDPSFTGGGRFSKAGSW